MNKPFLNSELLRPKETGQEAEGRTDEWIDIGPFTINNCF